jgi:hypothetical protein
MANTTRDWIEHALESARWQPERQVISLMMLGFVIALILGALYLSEVARGATTNQRLRDRLEERDELERQIEELRVEVAELKSLPRLTERAAALGFVPATRETIEHLQVEGYIPAEVETVAPIDAAPEAIAQEQPYNETFVDWVGRQWANLRRGIRDLLGG